MEDSKFAHHFSVACGYLGLGLSAFLMIVGIATATAQASTYIPVPISMSATSPQPLAAAVILKSPPHCAVVTDQDTYKTGDIVHLYWLGSNTAYSNFMSDASAPDPLPIPPGNFGHSGTLFFAADWPGTHTISLRAYNSMGQSSVCSKIISIN